VRRQSMCSQPASRFPTFFGPAWESPRFTIRANYADLGRSYFPWRAIGSATARGPFGEVRIRPLPPRGTVRVASRYETTEKHDLVIPYIRSTGTSAGASVELPWRFNASSQLFDDPILLVRSEERRDTELAEPAVDRYAQPTTPPPDATVHGAGYAAHGLRFAQP